MSLTVNIISKEIDFDHNALESEIVESRNDLFGFESWRKLLWGHKVIKSLGCEIICTLTETHIYAYDDEVIRLKEELLKILDNIELVATQTNIDKVSIEFRILNALEIIRIVEKNLDKVGVVIG